MSVYSMDYTKDTIDFDTSETDDISQTSGRQSSGMQGNQSGNPDCNFTDMADGLGGPVWENNANATLGQVFEYPADSGNRDANLVGFEHDASR